MFVLSVPLFVCLLCLIKGGRGLSCGTCELLCLLVFSISLFVCLLFVCFFVCLIKGGRRLSLGTRTLLSPNPQDVPLHHGEKVRRKKIMVRRWVFAAQSKSSAHQSELTHLLIQRPAARKDRSGRAGSCGRGRKIAPLPGKPLERCRSQR